MDRPFILHMVSPLKHVSPFDVNMAADAGFDIIQTYGGVELGEVAGLVQDIIFSRSPADARRTGLFIGGRDAGLALDMLESARKAMVPPFAISVFADPAGSFTTAAAMVTVAEKLLKRQGGSGLAGLSVKGWGATGVVGGAVAVLAAEAGAKVTLVSHRGLSAVEPRAAEFKRRFGVDLLTADASDDKGKAAALAEADVILAAGKPGVRVLSAANLAHARRLKVAADVNAVPPSGIEGIGAKDDGAPLAGTPGVGFGPLTIGNIKFKTQHRLLRMMREAEKPLVIDFKEAFRVAREIVG
jgi:methylene-tetrahydromethanopterin dehydrogenase